eukprot:GEMP01045044.1.p1 GENE.GEMP01045044.1~~GEMP01045044.1.p1  ORF type:complete len:285 (+),score=49.52 GEMP01045044.1:171-1025(+)
MSKHIGCKYLRNDPGAGSGGTPHQVFTMWGNRRAGTPPAQVSATPQNTGIRRRAASFSSLSVKTSDNSAADTNSALGKNECPLPRFGQTDERAWKASASSYPVRQRVADADPRDLAKLKRVFEREESFRTPYKLLSAQSPPWPVSVSALLTRPNDDEAFERWCRELDAIFPEERTTPSTNEDDSFVQIKVRMPSPSSRPVSPYVTLKNSGNLNLVPKQRSGSSKLGNPAMKAPSIHLRHQSPYAIKPPNHYKVLSSGSGPSFLLPPSDHPLPPCVPDPPFFVRT